MVIWSLFDGSGIMGLPWAECGHDVYCFNWTDANHGSYEPIRVNHPKIHYVNMWIDSGFKVAAMKAGIPAPGMIFAFPDCTELAVSGAKHGHTGLASVVNAQMVQEMAEGYGVPWMLENPVGKMSTAWRKPNHYFHPFEYGGYMHGGEEPFHPKMPRFDGYTKKTCIWAGGGFVMPAKRPGPINIGYFWGWKSIGGNSAKTKQLRSLTPRGFARAVFLANRED